uniref:3-deoxy-7-phosphoheptulonate synthase n=1 Tax=Saccharopolyspora galaxeae TaxID=2781241 RepID=UPI001F384A59|nr:3-deoxy-7-phosphoheptulonate synthase [Saccharopolyspora sp. HNM0986]
MKDSQPVAVKAAHQVSWEDSDVLVNVFDKLLKRPPLVSAESVHALAGELEFVARGEAVVIQAGECAEIFDDAAPDRIREKATQVHRLADIVEGAGMPAIRVGRLAGQYAKPRSQSTETLVDGTVLTTYLGDAVNAREATALSRRPDPTRLLAAYDHASSALEALFMRQLLISESNSGLRSMLAPTYVSHEALLLEFESALVRPDHVKGGNYASSAHLLWIGERTRQVDHAHVEFAEGISNPVGVKLGPAAEPADVVAIAERLTAGRRPGRVSMIVRMGAGRLYERLPALIDALGPLAREVVWLCDPMHGNTVRAGDGRKTRVMTDVVAEVEQFFEVLRARGCWPGGLHLETTPDDVSECVEIKAELASPQPAGLFKSACDPRLNYSQAERVVSRAVDLIGS